MLRCLLCPQSCYKCTDRVCGEPQPGTPFWDVYRLFNISDWSLSGVYWKAVFSQAPKVMSLLNHISVCVDKYIKVAALLNTCFDTWCCCWLALHCPAKCKLVEAGNTFSGEPFWKIRARCNGSTSLVRSKAVCGASLQVVALFFVCAFGSSLDVAAIQAESPEPLDFNHELQTVGAPALPADGSRDTLLPLKLLTSSCSRRAARGERQGCPTL